MRRYGGIIRLRPEKREECRRLCREVWPEAVATIAACGVRDHTIFSAVT